MTDPMADRLDDREHILEGLELPQPRAVGAPLPRGNGGRVQLPQTYDDLENMQSVPSPGPVLAPPPAPVQSARPALFQPQPASAPPNPAQPPQRALPSPKAPATGFQRAVGAVRAALPIVQKILPLLDGNFGTAVSNILTPPSPAPQPPRVDLTPIRASIAELQTTHRELRDQVTEQNASLKKVQDQLEMVREATDRNTLEQQELMEDLKSRGKTVNVIAFIAICLLAVSLVVNLVLLMHIQRVLP